ncbi:twitching motility protein PilT [Sulfolobus acidocaldarius SUSAZ]|nr:twitching motility protein PilT [Sulfolobus acidocaldarius SUSAZ]
MEVVVDTNFVIAVIFQDHIFHEQALEDWKKLEKAYLPFISLVEIAYFLVKNGIEVKSVMESILSDPKVEVVENTLEDLYFATRSDPRKYDDFNDFLIVSTARRLGLSVLTFDKKLKSKINRH